MKEKDVYKSTSKVALATRSIFFPFKKKTKQMEIVLFLKRALSKVWIKLFCVCFWNGGPIDTAQ